MNWKIRETKDYRCLEGLGVTEVTKKILSARGFENEDTAREFLESDYEKGNLDPLFFSSMKKAVDRIREAKKNNEKVLIFGDYDADGITSSVILMETLGELGVYSEVYIPDKRTEGYGLNLPAVEQFARKGFKLIISVDCGITGIEEVKKAEDLGIDVIITDHHHIPETLPNAYAIINPKIKDSGYPYPDLAGVGVAFKFAQAIYRLLIPEKSGQVKWMLDLVAIGTVADCVPLTGENRIFVKYGLIVLSKTRRQGLLQMFSVARLNIDENNIPNTRSISFHIAPRINAAGRVDHANLAYDLIIEKDIPKARDLALELENSNSSRQKMTELVVNDVREIAKDKFADKKFIFAVDENYPIGIVGLVAGKIAQEFNRPTAVLQKGEKESKGSFRSIPQLDIIEAIEKCSDLLLKFGGHSQAAGISLENSKIDKFFEKLGREIDNKLKDKDLSQQIFIDAEISDKEASYGLVEEIEKLKPFGEGNPEPVFLMKSMLIEDIRVLGKGEKHVKLNIKSASGIRFNCIGFYLAEELSDFKPGNLVDVVFNLQKDEWNGNYNIQLIILDMKMAKK